MKRAVAAANKKQRSLMLTAGSMMRKQKKPRVLLPLRGVVNPCIENLPIWGVKWWHLL
jgi:hypothetical protein